MKKIHFNSQLYKSKSFWHKILLLTLVGMIIYQQFLISDLSNQIAYMYDSSMSNSFHSRLDNLEGRSNRDSDRLDELEKNQPIIKNSFNQLDWRLKQLEWIHPQVKVNNTPPLDSNNKTQISTKEMFNANPGHVPDLEKKDALPIPANYSAFSIKK